ncbi:unnamed protein product [Lathyrus oleraceus]
MASRREETLPPKKRIVSVKVESEKMKTQEKSLESGLYLIFFFGFTSSR